MGTVNVQKPRKAKGASGNGGSATTVKKGKSGSGKNRSQPAMAPLPEITDAMIAERAYIIWTAKGCPLGQDKMNWYQAELELKMEAIKEG